MAKDKIKPAKPRTVPWILGLIVLSTLTILVILQTSNIWKRVSIETAGDSLALYALSTLNFIALIIFGFIFIRNIIKLLRERRASILGSKIKTRLLIYFFGISILPIFAMAVFSSLFLNRALERWFEQIPGSLIQETKQMQTNTMEERNRKLNETARMIVGIEENAQPTNEDLKRILDNGNLTRIEIISPTGEVLAESERRIDAEQKIELDRTINLIRHGKFNETEFTDNQGFDLAAADFADGRKLIIVPHIYPESSLNQTIEKSIAESSKFKENRDNIRYIGFSTLGLLTFLLMFAASWAAFNVSRGLTVPIRALAEGADEITRGNLSNRVEVFADDELALLVSSFNQMSAKLEENSAELSERRRYIETVLQSLSTGVISFDADNKLTTINRAAVRMLKLEEADLQKFPLAELINQENYSISRRMSKLPSRKHPM